MTNEQSTHAAIVQEYRLWMNRRLRNEEINGEEDVGPSLMSSFWELCWRKKLTMILDLSNRQRINGILVAYDEQAMLLESRDRLHLIPLRSINRISLAEQAEGVEEWRAQAPLHSPHRHPERISSLPFMREHVVPIAPMYWDC